MKYQQILSDVIHHDIANLSASYTRANLDRHLNYSLKQMDRWECNLDLNLVSDGLFHFNETMAQGPKFS